MPLNWEGKNCDKEIRDCRRELLAASDEQFQCVNGDCSLEQKKCICAPGWIHSASGFDVCDEDEDECVTGTHECEHQCVNTIGSYDCKCDKGYIKSSQNSNECDDVDECRHNNGGCEEFCVNTDGSFECSCPEGFTLDMRYERRCYDDDECEKNNGGCSQKCKNTHGSFYCGCEEGYYLDEDRLTCMDLDECHPEALPDAALSQDLNPSLKMFLAKMEPNGNCEQNCVNTEGSFHCTCENGYHLLSDGFTCIDDDECLNETDECSQKCINTDGSYDCSCNQGYKLDTSDWKTCHDIDECVEKQHDCRSPSLCENTVGSYECPCPAGYTAAMSRYSDPPCIDIDECLDMPCAHGGQCSNIEGSFVCTCVNTGFIGATCETDLDECQFMKRKCSEDCRDTSGDFQCKCKKGHWLQEDGFTCADVDECRCMNDQTYKVSVNLFGSFECVCPRNYALDLDRNCKDEDECKHTSCDLKTSYCNNLPGGFDCVCREGYEEDYTTSQCKDIDECATGSHTCDEGFVCQNTVPKYECVRPDVPTVCHEPIAPMPDSFQTGRKFNGENSQVIDLKITANDYYEFAIRFRTRDQSGVLMELSSRKSKKNKGQFIRVKLVDGLVQTVLSEGNSVKDAQNVTNSYSTGYFSTLTFRREFGTSGTLKISIDEKAVYAQDGFVQSMFGINMRRLELGGSKDGPLIDPSNSLDACFQKESTTFFEKYEIASEETSSSDQCFAEIVHGDGIYAEGNGYATFDISKLENLHRADSHFSFGFYAIIESNTGTIFKFGPLELSVKFGKLFLTLSKRGSPPKTRDLADWVVRDKKRNSSSAKQLHFCDGAKHIIKAKLIQEPNANTNKAIVSFDFSLFLFPNYWH
ncbi:unnamed protein product [Oikopleura dioica]|uniref:Uncharacterized protein n=1 Tax=Oikopleura dioica TaxID=34765 RepID=E4YN28_OIKDI|nr:unnamed protein product [Oikopleura dioica]